MKLISVLMPCYNDGAYIEEAVASVEAQTWPDVELIVVDDGSTDTTTHEVLERMEARMASSGKLGGRFKLVRQENQGPAAARNRAFSLAEGDYLLPLDADDRLDSEYLASAAHELEAHPEAGACYCHADYFGGEKTAWRMPDFSIGEMLMESIVFVSALIRREAFVQAGGFDESMREGLEDYDFFLSLMDGGWEIRQLPETLFFYRLKANSRNSRLYAEQRTLEKVYERIFEKHQGLYASHLYELIQAARAKSEESRERFFEVQYLRRSILDKSPKGIARLFMLRYTGYHHLSSEL